MGVLSAGHSIFIYVDILYLAYIGIFFMSFLHYYEEV